MIVTTPDDQTQLRQANAITSGRYDFSACQLDILFSILSMIQKDKIKYKVYSSDIEIITGRKWNNQQLRNSTESMGNRMFEIETSDTYTQLWLFQQVEFIKGQGCFEIMISEAAKPYFFELKDNYTYMQLNSVLGCTSKYAKRLYALACQWRKLGGTHPMQIEDLKKMLGLIDKDGKEQYVKISQFKEKVLDVAKKQINESTDISFDYKLIKRGRSFKEILMYVDIAKIKEEQLVIDFREPLLQKHTATIQRYGVSKAQASIIAKDHYNVFLEVVSVMNKEITKGKIKIESSGGYIATVFKNKGVL